jgi:hypothetical protein
MHLNWKWCDYTSFFSNLSMYNTINLRSTMQCKEEELDPSLMSFHLDVFLFVYLDL